VPAREQQQVGGVDGPGLDGDHHAGIGADGIGHLLQLDGLGGIGMRSGVEDAAHGQLRFRLGESVYSPLGPV
jgi:hypothetical protein